jgi:hypothetical protein
VELLAAEDRERQRHVLAVQRPVGQAAVDGVPRLVRRDQVALSDGLFDLVDEAHDLVVVHRVEKLLLLVRGQREMHAQAAHCVPLSPLRPCQQGRRYRPGQTNSGATG